jgi:glucose/arabinose dehydrogenase
MRYRALYHMGNSALSLSDVFARAVALVGGAARVSRQFTQGSPEPAWGSAPAIPPARPQGSIPTLKMPTAQGWSPGQTPLAAPGLKVNAFATGLLHPRWIHVLPNGDVLVAESSNVPRAVMRNVFDYAMVATMRRARAVGVSANRITLLRDADGDGVAEIREVFLEGLNQPFGMTLVGDTFYVGNTDGLVAFPYVAKIQKCKQGKVGFRKYPCRSLAWRCLAARRAGRSGSCAAWAQRGKG